MRLVQHLLEGAALGLGLGLGCLVAWGAHTLHGHIMRKEDEDRQ